MTTRIEVTSVEPQMDPEEWQRRKDAESENATHPCDDASPWVCMCAGACSCHWVQSGTLG